MINVYVTGISLFPLEKGASIAYWLLIGDSETETNTYGACQEVKSFLLWKVYSVKPIVRPNVSRNASTTEGTL